MQRKYIYIIVIWLTILLVATQEFLGLNSSGKATVDSANQLEENYDGILNTVTIYSQLIIKNFQNDDKNFLYTYKIKVDDVSGAYKYTKNDTEGYIVFSANGEAQFILNSNESLIIHELPNESTYTIEQTSTISKDYMTTVNDEKSTIATGNISQNNTVTFENKTIVKDIEETPIEDKKNPVTADYIIISMILFVICLISLIAIKSIGIKKFE